MSEQLDLDAIRWKVSTVRVALHNHALLDELLESDIPALLAEVTRLREALRRYGDHVPGCAALIRRECNCGFVSLLSSPHEEIGR